MDIAKNKNLNVLTDSECKNTPFIGGIRCANLDFIC